MTNDYRQNFHIKLKIGNIDFTKNLMQVRIVNSVAALMPFVVLDFVTYGEKIVTHEIFGKDEIKMTLVEVREYDHIQEVNEFTLIYIKADETPIKSRPMTPITSKGDGNDTYPEKLIVSFFIKEPMKNLNVEINKCFQEEKVRIPLDALTEICDIFVPGMKKEINRNFENDIKLPKTFNCPRMPFGELVKFLNVAQMGGYHKSPSIMFHDKDKFYTWSSRWKIKQSPDIIVHQLPSTGDIDPILERVFKSDNEFYSKIAIRTKFDGPQNLVNTGNVVVARVNPDDTLFGEHKINIMKEVLPENTARTGDNNRLVNDTVSDMSAYYQGAGWGKSQTYIRNHLSKQLGNVFEITMLLSRNVKIKKLMTPGICMELKTYSMDYLLYAGKYILVSTDLIFNREETEIFVCTSKLRAQRNNILDS